MLLAITLIYFAALIGVLLFCRPPGAPERPSLVTSWLNTDDLLMNVEGTPEHAAAYGEPDDDLTADDLELSGRDPGLRF